MRFKYLLGRLKLNRILLAWKVHVRKTKVQRLQYTIGSHAHYKRVLAESFKGLFTATQQQKEFRERVMNVVEEAQKRVYEQTLDCLKDEARRFTII